MTRAHRHSHLPIVIITTIMRTTACHGTVLVIVAIQRLVTTTESHGK
jgi:hypothetical protein